MSTSACFHSTFLYKHPIGLLCYAIGITKWALVLYYEIYDRGPITLQGAQKVPSGKVFAILRGVATGGGGGGYRDIPPPQKKKKTLYPPNKFLATPLAILLEFWR